MAKISKASKAPKAKTKPVAKAAKLEKSTKVVGKKAKPVKNAPAKSVKKPVAKATAPKGKAQGSRRIISDAKIAKLQKMYKAGKHSAQSLCDEFGISMATLFNYLKVSV